MAKSGRKAAKASGKQPAANSTSSAAAVAAVNATVPSNTETPPSPFSPAPANLLPFARTLPRDHVFVVHIERTPPSLRRSAFLVPVILNLLITAGLCWRLYYAAPKYLEQLITIFGYETRWTVDHSSTGTGDLMSIIANRFVLLLIDYGIFGLLGRWPWEFVFGDKYGRHTGVCGWRLEVGFGKTEEVVVRRGRKWDSSMYVSGQQRRAQDKPEKAWSQEEELAAYAKCSEALRKSTTAKTALSLLDRDWDLDYRAMLDATDLVAEKKVQMKDLDHLVLVPWDGKWYAWYPHRNETLDMTTEDQSEQTQMFQNFKQLLADIDCEEVFYRWIEIIQYMYETSATSKFNAEQKEEAEQELRKMLKARNKDDILFFKAVGGRKGIPGLGEEG